MPELAAARVHLQQCTDLVNALRRSEDEGPVFVTEILWNDAYHAALSDYEGALGQYITAQEESKARRTAERAASLP
jgi:hypothetical protein